MVASDWRAGRRDAYSRGKHKHTEEAFIRFVCGSVSIRGEHQCRGVAPSPLPHFPLPFPAKVSIPGRSVVFQGIGTPRGARVSAECPSLSQDKERPLYAQHTHCSFNYDSGGLSTQDVSKRRTLCASHPWGILNACRGCAF